MPLLPVAIVLLLAQGSCLTQLLERQGLCATLALGAFPKALVCNKLVSGCMLGLHMRVKLATLHVTCIAAMHTLDQCISYTNTPCVNKTTMEHGGSWPGLLFSADVIAIQCHHAPLPQSIPTGGVDAPIWCMLCHKRLLTSADMCYVVCACSNVRRSACRAPQCHLGMQHHCGQRGLQRFMCHWY
jgi:hypothetical protein